MIVVWILLILLLLILVWILAAPMILEIDTEEEIYQLKMPVIFKANLLFNENRVTIRFLFFMFIRYHFSPSIGQGKRGARKKKPGKRFRIFKLSRPRRGMLTTLVEVFKIFKIRRLYIDFDADDEMLNALLFPLCIRISNQQYRVMVNFDGYYRLILNLQWRWASFLWVGIRYGWRQYVHPLLVFK